jgi:glycine/D-amino acid oxidase-like deaminating enzyme
MKIEIVKDDKDDKDKRGDETVIYRADLSKPLDERNRLTNAYLAGLFQGINWTEGTQLGGGEHFSRENWLSCAVFAGKQIRELACSANNAQIVAYFEEAHRLACEHLPQIIHAELVLKEVRELETGDVPKLKRRWFGQWAADQKRFALAVRAFRRALAKADRIQKAWDDEWDERTRRAQERECAEKNREESQQRVERAEIRKLEAALTTSKKETEAVQERYDELIRALAYTSGGKVDPAQILLKYRRALDIQAGGDGTLRGAGGSGGGGVLTPTPSGPELRFDGPLPTPNDPIFKQIG